MGSGAMMYKERLKEFDLFILRMGGSGFSPMSMGRHWDRIPKQWWDAPPCRNTKLDWTKP